MKTKQTKLKKGDKIAIMGNYLLIKRKRLKLKPEIKEKVIFLLAMIFLSIIILILLFIITRTDANFIKQCTANGNSLEFCQRAIYGN